MDAFRDMTVFSLEQATVLPYLTHRLAMDGMRVIRLGHPAFGDPDRMIGENCLSEDKMSTYFMAINMGKKGLTLNLGSQEGRAGGPGDERKRENKRGVMGGERMGTREGTTKPLKRIKAVGKALLVGEVAYATLKQAIVNGDFHPGQRLVESRLSAQMKISRIPVREAIKKLEQDGLVERLEKGGCIVKNPSREEIEEMFGIRAVLESYAAALATRRMDLTTVKRMENTLGLYKEALSRSDTLQMMRLNDQLDEIIFKASANKRLYALIGNFRDFIFRYRRVLLTCPDYAAISMADHKKIVKAMKEGVPEKVERLTRMHLIRGKDILIRDMDAKEKSSGGWNNNATRGDFGE